MAMTLNSEEQERINNVYNEREKALANNSSMYQGLIDQAGQVRDQQNQYLAQQEQLQNEQLDKDLAYQEQVINKQKEEAGRNRDIESKKALNDYTAYINPYGLQNERLYGAGLGNSGVSETSKLGAHTAYQTRVSAGNTAYQKSIDNYNLAMDEARKDNDAQKAQNALNKLKLELQNNQDYFTNVSSLSQKKLATEQSLISQYTDQYNTVYNQIMKEQQQAEATRQWEAEYALAQQKQAQAELEAQREYELAKKKLSQTGGSGGTTTTNLTNGKSGTLTKLSTDSNKDVYTTINVQGVPIPVTKAEYDEIKNNPNGALAKDMKDYAQYVLSQGSSSGSSKSNNSSNNGFFKENAVTEAIKMGLSPAYTGVKAGQLVVDTFKRLFGKK